MYNLTRVKLFIFKLLSPIDGNFLRGKHATSLVQCVNLANAQTAVSLLRSCSEEGGGGGGGDTDLINLTYLSVIDRCIIDT